MDVVALARQTRLVVDAVETAIIGKRQIVEAALAVLFSDGHLLIEDIPGVGKTTLAKALARSLGCDFKRIQFTPDLLPSDITGTTVFDQKTGDFFFRQGPVFANIVLADEINRATPKTQSALLECMEERQVTVDGITHKLPEPFFVLATQNNIELSGTYPLPEAQLDRFTARLNIGYPSINDELIMLDKQTHGKTVDTIEAVMGPADVIKIRDEVRNTYVDPSLKRYVVDVVTATRESDMISLGASPRGSLTLLFASQALAAISGRDYVSPDDIKAMAIPVLAHRVIVKPEFRLRGTSSRSVISEILQKITVPVITGSKP